MQKPFTVFDVVASKMGHDKDKIYVIIEVLDKDFVLIADGDKRKIENPKKKRQKHLRFLTKTQLDNGFKDENIRAILKEWRNNAQRG